MKKQIVLMDKAAISRTLKRMAIQVWEQTADAKDIVIIGLNERGFATAQLLAENLKYYSSSNVAIHKFDVSKGSRSDIPDCNDKYVLLVDDVIFSGKTMFEALSIICSINEPAAIEIAALLDRGHRKYPIRTYLTGKKIPTKFGEHIEVMLNKGMLEQAILFKN